MFSLIITIISIALVAALAVASIYYGGNAFTKGGDSAKAAQYINEGQQISGAVTLANADAAVHAAQADLVTGQYLTQVISDYSTDTSGSFVSTPSVAGAVSASVCDAVNKKAGLTSPVLVTDIKVYGCVTGAIPVVSYKL